MHELSIAARIIQIVERERRRSGLSILQSVDVRVGTLSGVDPGALAFSYNAACVGTGLEGSRLVVHRSAAVGVCRDCGRTFEVQELLFRCPGCGSGGVELTAGQEIELESICGE